MKTSSNPNLTNGRSTLRRVALFVLGISWVSPSLGVVWPNAADRVEKQLRSEDVETRRLASAKLNSLPRNTARRLAKLALEDPDVDVRLAAARAALGLNLKGLGRLVIPWLSAPERAVRLAAAEILISTPSPDAINPLGRSLSDQDPAVRGAAAQALGASAAPQAVIPLLGHLDDSSVAVRQHIVEALAKLADKRAVVPLIGKIQDRHPNVRRTVARALGRLGDPRAESALLLALRDNDESVKVAALESLGRLGNPRTTLAVAAKTRESSSRVRAAAYRTLVKIGTPQALNALLKAMDDERSPSLLEAALAESNVNAHKLLRDCLSASRRRADGCVSALAALGDEKASPLIVRALKRGSVSPAVALRALGKVGTPAALSTVLAFLSSADPSLRRTALATTHQLLDSDKPDGRAVEPLIIAFKQAKKDPSEQLQLIKLLGETGSPRAAKFLMPLADKTDVVAVRVAALLALGKIQQGRADAVLIKALSAEEGKVRLAAAVALRRVASGQSAGDIAEPARKLS